MKDKSIQIKVGLLVLFSLALLGAFVVVLGDVGSARKTEFFADFPNSADLKPGAPVKIAGIDAGKVSKVTFLDDKSYAKGGQVYQVRVTLGLYPQFGDVLRDDAAAIITTLGLLGEKYVELEVGTFSQPRLPQGSVVVGEPPVRLELLAKQVNDVIAKVDRFLGENNVLLVEILTNVNNVLKSANARVDELGIQIDTLGDSLGRSLTTAEAILAAAKKGIGAGDEIRNVLTQLDSTTRRFDTAIGPLLGEARATVGDARGAIGTYDALGQDARKQVQALGDRGQLVLDNAVDVTSRIAKGEGTVGKFLQDTEIYDKFKELVADLRRNPWKAIWKE